jgi:hypothetical protein
MFKRRRDRSAKRARCFSWVLGAMKGKAASVQAFTGTIECRLVSVHIADSILSPQ